jgi:hypothetical protein
MQNVFKALILSLSFAGVSAEARSLVPRQEHVRLVENLHLEFDGQGESVLATTSFDNYGEVKTFLEFPAYNGNVAREPITLKKRPGDLNLNLLRNRTTEISDAEVSVERKNVICRMLPPFGHMKMGFFVREGLSTETGISGGQLREVLSPRGCWVSRVTQPVEAREQQAAAALAEALRILRNEALESLR